VIELYIELTHGARQVAAALRGAAEEQRIDSRTPS
jgi:hypothetical protein